MTRHYMALCYLLPCGLALIAYRVVVLVPRQIVDHARRLSAGGLLHLLHP
jgi:hypothetical protein